MPQKSVIERGIEIVHDKKLWENPKATSLALQKCGELLAQLEFIEIEHGKPILVVCSSDDADTLADGFITALG